MKTSIARIFVVDDNEYTQMQIKRNLKKIIPCEVIAYSSAAACLGNLHLNPDFILSDYNLKGESEKGMNGEQLLMLIKDRRPTIPVLIYSSQESIRLAVRLIKKGACDFINSDSISKTSAFAKKIAHSLRVEQETLRKKSRDRKVLLLVLAVVALFISLLFTLNAFAPVVLPYAVFAFLVGMSIMVFIRKTRLKFPTYWSKEDISINWEIGHPTE